MSDGDDRVQRAEADVARVSAELRGLASALTHELKEPARMVAGFLQLFQDRFGEKIDPDGAELLTFAVDGARRMQQLLDLLGPYARLVATPPQLAPVETEQALAEVLDGLRELRATSGGQVTHDPLPRLVADPARFRQALTHLVRNALIFRGTKAPQVHVTAQVDADRVTFSVTDQGLGIAPEHHDEVFRLFRRLHHRDRFPGHGVGLAVVRQIAEQHGGRAWVESELGQGAVFFFALPARGTA